MVKSDHSVAPDIFYRCTSDLDAAVVGIIRNEAAGLFADAAIAIGNPLRRAWRLDLDRAAVTGTVDGHGPTLPLSRSVVQRDHYGYEPPQTGSTPNPRDALVWYNAYAAPAYSEKLAEEALAAIPANLDQGLLVGLRATSLVNAARGRVLFLARQQAEAIPRLEHATKICTGTELSPWYIQDLA